MTDDKKITDLSVARFEKHTKLIQLIDNRYQSISPEKCHHRSFLIDDKKVQVECKDCETLMNPMYVLQKLCTDESRYMQEKKRYIALLRELKKKSRTKCKHCGKFTDIRL